MPSGQAGNDVPASRCARPSDVRNVLLADVRGAPGPFPDVFPVTERRRTQSSVGRTTTIAGLPGLLVQAPIGGVIDSTWSSPFELIRSQREFFGHHEP